MRYTVLLALALFAYHQANAEPIANENNLLGLPPVPIPINNPQTSAKIVLGDQLFHDKRFSVDGTVSCQQFSL